MFLTRARFSFGCDDTIESQYFAETHEIVGPATSILSTENKSSRDNNDRVVSAVVFLAVAILSLCVSV